VQARVEPREGVDNYGALWRWARTTTRYLV
jgi:hypothetical protein